MWYKELNVFACNICTKSNAPTWLLRAKYSVHSVFVLQKIQLRILQVKEAATRKCMYALHAQCCLWDYKQCTIV